MISSMTGYARQIKETDRGELTWALRSLNQRSLDIHINLPDKFRPVEAQCRRKLNESFERGRIDASLLFNRVSAESEPDLLDQSVLTSLFAHAEEVQKHRPDAAALSIAEVLRWPGVICIDEEPDEAFYELTLQLLDESIEELTMYRRREGNQVKEILQDKLKLFKSSCDESKNLVPEAQQSLRERFKEKLEDLDVEVDPGRLEQEIGLALTKLDVAEEIDRIDLHVAEFERVLAEDSVVGKRLGYLLQELVREVNTLGAKTQYFPLNSLTVDMKVILEQIREQVQNVE